MANNAHSKKRRDELILAVAGKFIPAFAPSATVLYRGDRRKEQAGHDAATLGGLGISDLKPDRIPDVIIHHAAKNHLILIDTVPGHGPINARRHDELTHSFTEVRPHLILITAFLNRSEAAKHLNEISWATEVWSADAETHLIHFNGERLLGPYDDAKGTSQYAKQAQIHLGRGAQRDQRLADHPQPVDRRSGGRRGLRHPSPLISSTA